MPAGMELFSAGNESQWEVIKRWIDESDVFLLILGGRYGAIEPNSKKSYTQLEYEYAIESKKPFFAVIMNDGALDEKVRVHGKECLEIANHGSYIKFKEVVKSKMCKFFDDVKDIRIAIFETLSDFQNRYKMTGWISGKEFYDSERYINEISRLLEENNQLKDKERELLQKIKQIQKENNPENNSKDNVKCVDISYLGDLEERIERITELLKAENETGKVLSWVINDETKDEHGKTIETKPPRGDFEAYYFFMNTGSDIDHIAFIYVDEDTSFNLMPVLADIRMMLEDYKDIDEDMRYRFILVNMGFTEAIKDNCYLYFEEALKKAQIESKRSLYPRIMG